jgi:hypothetical protein
MNVGALLRGRPATSEPTWNAVCLADFGDSGVASLAQPQIPGTALRGRNAINPEGACHEY